MCISLATMIAILGLREVVLVRSSYIVRCLFYRKTSTLSSKVLTGYLLRTSVSSLN
jgi:hypothetical protein